MDTDDLDTDDDEPVWEKRSANASKVGWPKRQPRHDRKRAHYAPMRLKGLKRTRPTAPRRAA